MALTNQEILGIINNTASTLGFDFVATENNIDDVIVTHPGQVNRFIDALNPIIHDKIMNNLGKRGFMKRFVSEKKGGAVSRHISFGYATDNESNSTEPTLEGLVGSYKNTPDISIFSINKTYSQPVTVDRRELAKIFTPNTLIEYIRTLNNHLENSFNIYILNEIMNIAYANTDKMIKRVIDPIDFGCTLPLIELHQAIYSGSFANSIISSEFDTFSIPNNVNINITPYECALLVDCFETEWYTKYHFLPDGIDRMVVPSSNTAKSRAFFLIPYDSIVIEEYNRYNEVQDIPNNPGKYNVFFNSDITIGMDFKYPIGVLTQES